MMFKIIFVISIMNLSSLI